MVAKKSLGEAAVVSVDVRAVSAGDRNLSNFRNLEFEDTAVDLRVWPQVGGLHALRIQFNSHTNRTNL